MKKNSTLIVAIIDRSGSMRPLTEETILGFNKFLEEQRRVPGECRMTLVQFSTFVQSDYWSVPLEQVTFRYQVDGGTALLDAMGSTIDHVGEYLSKLPESERPEKVIVMVITDGHENASKKYSKADVARRVKHQQEKYGWHFIFMGANMDAIGEAQSLGISPAMAANYAAGNIGSTYAVSSSNIANTRTTGGSPVFTDEQRKKLVTEKQ